MKGEKITVFFLPFAGGSRYSYNQFKQNAPAWIKVEPLDLPGRGSRFKEDLLNTIEEVVDDLYDQIKDKLDKPYAIYGHSMGATLGYLLTRKINDLNKPMPQHVFLTGTCGPAADRETKIRSTMPKDEFIAEVKNMGGSPDEILNDDQLMEFFEPILRGDFRILESYNHIPQEPLEVPFTVVIGADEEVTEKEGKAWGQEFSTPLDFHIMPGNHFFIFDQYKDVLRLLARRLSALQPMP
ncbi:thioesterase II family protein [Roseivirga sp. BDSF3-8]|uniref:thioesterase II family protein n=1 Tax=Roseivirga sp. BDSF3-8 TaxID=3241598 RepID=UPI003531B3F2